MLEHLNFYFYILIMMIGLYAMITKNNLIKKLIGMSIFQTGIILFYVSIAVKKGATIPIIEHLPTKATEEVVHYAINPDHHANPLTHVLMLTAIVVGVATLGVGLAVCQLLYQDYGSLEESEILDKIEKEGDIDG